MLVAGGLSPEDLALGGYGDHRSRALNLGDDAGRIRRAGLPWLQGLAPNRVGARLTRRLSLRANSRGWLPMFAVKLDNHLSRLRAQRNRNDADGRLPIS